MIDEWMNSFASPILLFSLSAFANWCHVIWILLFLFLICQDINFLSFLNLLYLPIWLWLWLLAALDFTCVLITAWELWKKPFGVPLSWKSHHLSLILPNHVTFFTKQGMVWLLVYWIILASTILSFFLSFLYSVSALQFS